MCTVGHRTKLLHTEIVEEEPLQGGNDYIVVAHQVQACTVAMSIALNETNPSSKS